MFSGGDFGTMIVHGEDETEESYSGAQLAKEKESSPSQVDGVSVRFSGEQVAGSWYLIFETLLVFFFREHVHLITNMRLYFFWCHPV